MSEMKKRPNIVFILSDDQGEWAMGCSGNQDIVTPNLDNLAENGMRFDHFFCTSPVCSPARASIITGKIPSQHGVQDWIKGGNVREGGIDYLEGHLAYTDVLAQNGYNCGLSGKWHLGNSFVPQKSFTHWYTHLLGSGNYFNAPMIRNGELEYEPRYVTDAITEDAVEYIKEHAGEEKPFYLSVHYTAAHDPWVGDNHPEKYKKLYKDCAFESCPQRDVPHEDAVYPYSKEDARESLIGYFSSITGMDVGIGEIVKTLEEQGILEDTLIVFTSDNGFNCGHHGLWGKGNACFSLNMFDTSVKVPLLVSHKGAVAEGKLCQELLSQYDIFPTLLDYVGIHDYVDATLPGESFVGMLQGEVCPGHEDVVIYDEYGPCRMIRSKTHKYVHRFPSGPYEFYDLVADPKEENNLYGDPAYAEMIADYRDRLIKWFCTYADPAIDGVRESVKGNGQLTRPGIYANGQEPFDQNRVVVPKPYAKVGPEPPKK